MIIAAVLILIPVLLLIWLVMTIDKGVLQLRRIADELQRQRESKPTAWSLPSRRFWGHGRVGPGTKTAWRV